MGGGGNYLINIGLRPDGVFEPTVVANMKEVGKWVKAHGDAIYGTRAGDFSEKGKYASTQKGNTTNLFVFDDRMQKITLENSNRKLLKVKNEKGNNVDFINDYYKNKSGTTYFFLYPYGVAFCSL